MLKTENGSALGAERHAMMKIFIQQVDMIPLRCSYSCRSYFSCSHK
jgi:hypothetical protein